MKWTKPLIVKELKRLHKAGADISYNALARRKQPLLSAAAYHFSGYPRAVAAAGIDYDACTRRPRWSKSIIISMIKKARRRGDDLHWSAVTKRNDELSRAAFASLQLRLFGQWARALHAAGLHADDVSLYRTWDRNTVAFELRARHRDEESLNSGDVQREDPALHAAAVRHFKQYDRALGAAGLNPADVRRRRAWNRSAVVRALRLLARKQQKLTDTTVRKQDAALHGAAVRLFGSFSRARAAAER